MTNQAEENQGTVLADLTAELGRQGLTAFLAAFAPHSAGRGGWAERSAGLGEPLRMMVEVFTLAGSSARPNCLMPSGEPYRSCSNTTRSRCTAIVSGCPMSRCSGRWDV